MVSFLVVVFDVLAAEFLEVIRYIPVEWPHSSSSDVEHVVVECLLVDRLGLFHVPFDHGRVVNVLHGSAQCGAQDLGYFGIGYLVIEETDRGIVEFQVFFVSKVQEKLPDAFRNVPSVNSRKLDLGIGGSKIAIFCDGDFRISREQVLVEILMPIVAKSKQ